MSGCAVRSALHEAFQAMPGMTPCRMHGHRMMTRLSLEKSLRDRVCRYPHAYRVVIAEIRARTSDTDYIVPMIAQNVQLYGIIYWHSVFPHAMTGLSYGRVRAELRSSSGSIQRVGAACLKQLLPECLEFFLYSIMFQCHLCCHQDEMCGVTFRAAFRLRFRAVCLSV